MRFDLITLFPELFTIFKEAGIMGRAVARDLVELELHDLRTWAGNRWNSVDDEPYGGGPGMVIQAPPVLAAVREVAGADPRPAHAILLTPRGRVLDQEVVEELAGRERLLLVCGRYEGCDERVNELLELDEISLGDFVLGGGEVAAMALVEAVSRLLPGVVGDPESVVADSFSAGLLDHPCYTRPAEVEGLGIPEVLLSGNHERVRRWRLERAVELTASRRPDLIRTSWSTYPKEVRELVSRFAPGLVPE
jgi:tRNA (guanine37-N1)-methyltransferase